MSRAAARRLAGKLGALALAAALSSGCAGLGGVAGRPLEEPEARGEPEARPASRAGWQAYEVGALVVEAPAGWRARGDRRRLELRADDAVLSAWVVDQRFEGSKACLAAAEESLQRGEGTLERVRRHGTTVAGKPAVTQEADAAGWHGWAWAICSGPVQYRLLFQGRSPIPPARLDDLRDILKQVRFGGAA